MKTIRQVFETIFTELESKLHPSLLAILESEVSSVTSNSKHVQKGSIFVAISGETIDGHRFIHEAEKAGAILIVGEQTPQQSLHIPYFQVSHSRKILAQLAAAFYDHPANSLFMIGITGTSGKTTLTYLMEAILKQAGHQVGVIGTINYRYATFTFSSTHTTPGPVELQKLLSEMLHAGCTAVVMEVSSHSLKQRRVNSIAYDGLIFTNLSPEHLDFHTHMEDYFQSKSLLFTEIFHSSDTVLKHPVAAIYESDEFGRRLIQTIQTSPHLSQRIQVYPFCIPSSLQTHTNGIRGTIEGIVIESNLIGAFNAANIAAAVKLSQGLKISSKMISKGINAVQKIPGRLEPVNNKSGLHIWIDYAHKPDALKKVLETLNGIRKEQQRLLLVFGCGGDRDRQKRPIMGKLAYQQTSHTWITSDNPRTEDPQSIVSDILTGIPHCGHITVELNRRKAIFQSIEWALPGDFILIAGKGHETYQIVGTEKIDFDDQAIVKEALEYFYRPIFL